MALPRVTLSLGLIAALAPAVLAPTPVGAQAPPPPATLHDVFARQLQSIAEGLDGVMGYTVVDLTNGDRFERLADREFPTASTIKLAILYELFVQADAKRVDLDRPFPLPASARVGGDGVLKELSAPSLPLRDYATLMALVSDNTATNALIDVLGMPAVDARMDALGLKTVRLRRRMMDTAAAREGKENVASPRELAALLDTIRQGTGLTPASREAALDILTREKSTALTRGLPEGTRVASKPGSLDGVRADTGIVFVEKRPYLFVAMCAWLADDVAGERAIEAASRAAYAYFSRLAQGGAYGRMIRN